MVYNMFLALKRNDLKVTSIIYMIKMNHLNYQWGEVILEIKRLNNIATMIGYINKTLYHK